MYPCCESASIALNSFLLSVREANLALICEVVCLDGAAFVQRSAGTKAEDECHSWADS
jgi:hypothetical protein